MTQGQMAKHGHDKNRISKRKHGVRISKTGDKARPGFECSYVKEARCWRGPVTCKKDTLQITKVLNDKKKQRDKQIPECLHHNRKKAQKYREPEVDSEEETRSTSLNENKESPVAERPFRASSMSKNEINWSVPFTGRKSNVCWFEKQSNLSLVQCALYSPAQQAKKLQQTLTGKDEEIDVLRTQLLKSQQENMKLVLELKQCSGLKYDDMMKDNRSLKEQVERLTRQTTKLHGDSIREKNHVLQKIKYEQNLENKYNIIKLSVRKISC